MLGRLQSLDDLYGEMHPFGCVGLLNEYFGEFDPGIGAVMVVNDILYSAQSIFNRKSRACDIIL